MLVGLLKTQLFIETCKTCVKGDLVRRSGSHFGLAKYNVCSAFIPAGHFLRAEPTLECRFLQYTISLSRISRGLPSLGRKGIRKTSKESKYGGTDWLFPFQKGRETHTHVYVIACIISNNLLSLREGADHTHMGPLSFCLTGVFSPICSICFGTWHCFLWLF